MATPTPPLGPETERESFPRQDNRDNAIGFQGGEHHHYYEQARPLDAVGASLAATAGGDVLGARLEDWDPAELGVHACITVGEETGLTPYFLRAHDHTLRDNARQVNSSGRPRLLVVVGTSCTGKTRALYEAIRVVLREWRVVAPRTDGELVRLLGDGIPMRTVVWLDELQDRLTNSADGIATAKAIRRLLDAPNVGPLLFAGTIWPSNLATLLQRPTPEAAATGAGAISQLLAAGVLVDVPETFNETDLKVGAAESMEDPRMSRAAETATRTENGRKIIQVLAGGTQLVQRLYPPSGSYVADKFSPAAAAILYAAADLRRIGMPNPLPAWAIYSAAPGYLEPPNARPPEQWFPSALAEVTRAAASDDALIGIHTLDIANAGVPALTPAWTTGTEDALIESYAIHEYLFQEHLRIRSGLGIPKNLWATVSANSHRVDRSTLLNVANGAERCGMETLGIEMMRGLADQGDWTAQERLLFRLGKLAKQGDLAALGELRDLSHRFGRVTVLGEALATLATQGVGDHRLLDELALLALTGGSAKIHTRRLLAHLEYSSRAGNNQSLSLLRSVVASSGMGSGHLGRALASAVQQGDAELLEELVTLGADSAIARPFAVHALLDLVDAGDSGAENALRALLNAGVPRGTKIAGLSALASRGDREALNRLRTVTGGKTKSFLRTLGHLAIAGNRDALVELEELAKRDQQASKRYKHVMLSILNKSGTDHPPN